MTAESLFGDFEPYCEAITHVDLRMRVLGMERPRYSLMQTTVGRLGVQFAREGSGQLSEGSTDGSAHGLYLPLNSRPRLINGMVIDRNTIVVLPPKSEFCFSCDHANSWVAIRVPTKLLRNSEGERRRRLLDTVSVIRPGQRLLTRLRRIVLSDVRGIHGLKTAPSAAIATSLVEAELLSIARELCFHSSTMELQFASRLETISLRHVSVAKAAAARIEAALDDTVSVSGIADSIGVSERTLLTAFKSRFAMPPRRFIQALRLNRARKLLCQVSYPEILIQDIAEECGFRDFGRFAARYQQLFGELPTQTARKASPSQ